MNRFRKSENVQVAGFEFKKYGSLQARERHYLLEVKRKLFDRSTAFLDLAQRMSQELSISEQEAWAVLQTGAASANPELKVRLLPYIAELTHRLNPEYASVQYPKEAVILLFLSRLNDLKSIAKELEEAFDIALNPKSVQSFDKVPYSDRLQSAERIALSRQIVEQLPEDVFDELLAFIAGEERQWKTIDEAEKAEVDDKDPFSTEA